MNRTENLDEKILDEKIRLLVVELIDLAPQAPPMPDVHLLAGEASAAARMGLSTKGRT